MLTMCNPNLARLRQTCEKSREDSSCAHLACERVITLPDKWLRQAVPPRRPGSQAFSVDLGKCGTYCDYHETAHYSHCLWPVATPGCGREGYSHIRSFIAPELYHWSVYITYSYHVTNIYQSVNQSRICLACESKARFPFKRNRMRCVRCVDENRKKRKRLRWQAANHGCHCFDRASYWLQAEWKPGLKLTGS